MSKLGCMLLALSALAHGAAFTNGSFESGTNPGGYTELSAGVPQSRDGVSVEMAWITSAHTGKRRTENGV
jgi:hypothetical protein